MVDVLPRFVAADPAGHRSLALVCSFKPSRALRFRYCLAAGARVPVYTTEVYFNTSRTPTDWGLASTYAMMLLVLSMALLFVYFRLVRHTERYQTITGKDFKPRRIDLGAWRYLTCGLSLLLVFLITGLPFIMMLYASLMPRFQPPSRSIS